MNNRDMDRMPGDAFPDTTLTPSYIHEAFHIEVEENETFLEINPFCFCTFASSLTSHPTEGYHPTH